MTENVTDITTKATADEAETEVKSDAEQKKVAAAEKAAAKKVAAAEKAAEKAAAKEEAKQAKQAKQDKEARYVSEVKDLPTGATVVELKQVGWVGPGTIFMYDDLEEVIGLLNAVLAEAPETPDAA